MKVYVKPEVAIVDFATEEITTAPGVQYGQEVVDPE